MVSSGYPECILGYFGKCPPNCEAQQASDKSEGAQRVIDIVQDQLDNQQISPDIAQHTIKDLRIVQRRLTKWAQPKCKRGGAKPLGPNQVPPTPTIKYP
ncbi:MAG TPA: hypothetical protein VF189_01755 [Patescibacteria group bacterium]